MNKQITIPFPLTGWDAVPYDETTENPMLARVVMKTVMQPPTVLS
jgi:hypothetical protein